jgi:hypothetical protein
LKKRTHLPDWVVFEKADPFLAFEFGQAAWFRIAEAFWPQQRLYFWPDLQGQGVFRPIC